MGLGRRTTEGPFTAAHLDLFGRVLPHLASAALVRRRLRALLAASEAPRAVLAALDRGVILVDAAARLVWANPAAERLLARRYGLSVDRTGALVATRPAETAVLRRLIAGAAAAGSGEVAEAGGALPLPRPSDRPLVVRVLPLAPGADLAGLPPLPRRPAAALLVSDPDEAEPPPEALLRQAYGLTRAEAALAARLAEGVGLREVADALGISGNTAKAQLKAVFAKVGVDRQAALVRRVMDDLGEIGNGATR